MTISAQIARVQAELLRTLFAALDAGAAPGAAAGKVALSGMGQQQTVRPPTVSAPIVQATLLGFPGEGEAMPASAASRRDGQEIAVRADGSARMAEALINGRTVRLMLDPGALADGPLQQKLVPGARLTLAFEPQTGDGVPRARIVDLRLAGSVGGTPPLPDATAGATPSARVLAAPAAIAALARQDSAAALLASLQALARQPGIIQGLPVPVQRAIAAVLGLAATPDALASPDGKALRQAVATSGLFHEAQARDGSATPGEGPVNLKGALIGLRTALNAALVPGSALATGDASAGDKATGTLNRPAPPVPDGALQPRGDVTARLAETSSALPVMAQLLGETQAALDRLTLHQFASLPETAGEGGTNQTQPPPGQAAGAQTPTRLMLELPFLLDGKAGTLPLTIEQEPPERGHGEGEVARSGWRVRLAFDLEPLGLVQALIGLQAGALRVAVFAEREATARLARRHAGDLESALADGPFKAAVVDVALGSPPAVQAKAGHFLDRRT